MAATGVVPGTWVQFKASSNAELVPKDHARRARDRLKKRKQRKFVSKHSVEFCNYASPILNMNESEQAFHLNNAPNTLLS